MFFAAAGVLAGLASWKWGDWRNWQKYYPTILYVILGNMASELLMYRTPLWEYSDMFGDYMVLLIGQMVLLFPGMVILYLSLYPQKPVHQVLYILAWTLGFTLLEAAAMRTNTFDHYRGWNIWYTALHDLVMFLLLRLHFKKPLLVWPVSFAVAFAVLWYFRLPLDIAR